jgi:hypothetical protein
MVINGMLEFAAFPNGMPDTILFSTFTIQLGRFQTRALTQRVDGTKFERQSVLLYPLV